MKLFPQMLLAGPLLAAALLTVLPAAPASAAPVRCRVVEQPHADNVSHGINLWYCDDSGKPTYEESFMTDAEQGFHVDNGPGEAYIYDWTAMQTMLTSPGGSVTVSPLATTFRTADVSGDPAVIDWLPTNSNQAWEWDPVGPQTYEAHVLNGVPTGQP
jgi:hypothetical protein